MNIPSDYYERVYAGVLGKIIGVYLGRPFEGWSYERIMQELGEIKYYVHERHDLPLHNHRLVVTDDDISGTFTFLRALQDYHYSLDLTPQQIGQTWLNYIIENRTILWWGGLGNSTEHTAYLRLKDGIAAPRSGSMALNGKVVSEQIGAQIFIEGWGLVSPGDPALAADLAHRAASVSHDGEAIYGAQVIAALVAQAFVEADLEKMLDVAISCIPADSVINHLVGDIRDWHANEPRNWHAARAKLAARYGYDRYGGNCHVVPNHGLVILSLLYSQGDFNKAQTIVNTCGWDTDCNAANVGCILGVRDGLAAFEHGPDWRGPVGDRLYLPTADGGGAMSDALRETDLILETAHRIHGMKWNPPKDGARFHFSLPGSVQGFRCQDASLRVENVVHPLRSGERLLAIRCSFDAAGTSTLATPTFIPPEDMDMPGYSLLASPTLYPGQTLRARLFPGDPSDKTFRVGLTIDVYDESDSLRVVHGPMREMRLDDSLDLEWQLPDLGGAPIADVGISVSSDNPTEGSIYLDFLTWDGCPQVTFQKPGAAGNMWKRQWVNAADYFENDFGEAFRIIQNRGRGLVITGTRDWTDYRVESAITPHMARAFGIAARVQGQERYYALILSDQSAIRLIKRLDGESILVEQALAWQFGQTYALQLQVQSDRIRAWIDDILLFDIIDPGPSLSGGGIAFVCEEGRIGAEQMRVAPCSA